MSYSACRSRCDRDTSTLEEITVSSTERPEHPDDHKRFSLGEDWIATLVGLLLFAACMLGLVSPELIP
jgi:hypothetical protein